jgi:hypothetical protein
LGSEIPKNRRVPVVSGDSNLSILYWILVHETWGVCEAQKKFFGKSELYVLKINRSKKSFSFAFFKSWTQKGLKVLTVARRVRPYTNPEERIFF